MIAEPSQGDSPADPRRAAVIVVAAGEGTRLGYGMPKAYVPLAGRPLLLWCLEGVRDARTAFNVVVVAPTDLVDRTRDMVAGLSFDIRVVGGGTTRQASVAAGLRTLDNDVDTVLVHDAARALTPGSLLDLVAETVRREGVGVIPGLPVADTIKRVADDRVTATVDRSELSAVQTPQGFPRGQLVAAYAAASTTETDDAGVFTAAGYVVRTVPGDPAAAKITTRADLERAELQLGEFALRTGVGVDAHSFAPAGDRVLRLAGLEWPGERALDGHSDGDAVAHAVCDALLSAAGLGDIGSRFGVDDPAYAGAAGSVFVRGAVGLLDAEGWRPLNVAVQIVGNRPRFAARRAEAEAALTALVGAPVSISATTTDGLGFTGRGEGVQVVATALVRSRTTAPR